MTTNTLLVTVNSVLNQHGLTPDQLRQLLKALHCQTYQLETRLYVRRSAKRLIASLLAPRYGNTPIQTYLDKLEETTFLYKCNSCGELLFFTELLLGEQQLTHTCLLDRRPRRDLLGHLELVGSARLSKLVEQHYALFPVEDSLILAA
ncbi:MAG: hypothetical protein AAFZ17_01325 [Cyanobacteria bacterium J06650_10]